MAGTMIRQYTATSAPIQQYNLTRWIVDQLVLTMRQRGVIKRQDRPRFWAYPWHNDRLQLFLNQQSWNNRYDPLTTAAFTSQARDNLQGRRVVVTRGTGVSIQVSWEPVWGAGLQSVPFDLKLWNREFLSVPLGMSRRGPTWQPLTEMESVLICGARQRGKTTLLHTWLLSLVLNSPRRVKLMLYDGKGGLKFNGYGDLPHVAWHPTNDEELGRVLGDMLVEMQRRWRLMAEHRAQHIMDLDRSVRPPHIVLVIDEAHTALLNKDLSRAIEQLVQKGGDAGILPILVLQIPDTKVIPRMVLANLTTRISFYQADAHKARSVGVLGANKIPANAKGRFRIATPSGAREVQGYALDGATVAGLLPKIAARWGVAAQSSDSPAPSHADEPLPSLSKPPQVLTPEQIRMVEACVREADGRFSGSEIHRLTGLPLRGVRDQAGEWEVQGLLTPSYNSAQGRKPRRITRRLLRLAGIEVTTRAQCDVLFPNRPEA